MWVKSPLLVPSEYAMYRCASSTTAAQAPVTCNMLGWAHHSPADACPTAGKEQLEACFKTDTVQSEREPPQQQLLTFLAAGAGCASSTMPGCCCCVRGAASAFGSLRAISLNSSFTFAAVLADVSMKNRPFSVAYAVASSTVTARALSRSALLPVCRTPTHAHSKSTGQHAILRNIPTQAGRVPAASCQGCLMAEWGRRGVTATVPACLPPTHTHLPAP